MTFSQRAMGWALIHRTGVCACAAASLFSVLFASPVLAQFDTGQISGFVRDSSGAVVPGVTVTATNEGNGQLRVVVSNSEGYYVFPSLLVGAYKFQRRFGLHPP